MCSSSLIGPAGDNCPVKSRVRISPWGRDSGPAGLKGAVLGLHCGAAISLIHAPANFIANYAAEKRANGGTGDSAIATAHLTADYAASYSTKNSARLSTTARPAGSKRNRNDNCSQKGRCSHFPILANAKCGWYELVTFQHFRICRSFNDNAPNLL